MPDARPGCAPLSFQGGARCDTTTTNDNNNNNNDDNDNNDNHSDNNDNNNNNDSTNDNNDNNKDNNSVRICKAYPFGPIPHLQPRIAGAAIPRVLPNLNPPSPILVYHIIV